MYMHIHIRIFAGVDLDNLDNHVPLSTPTLSIL